MKHKAPFIATFLFLILVQTQPLWEGHWGGWHIIVLEALVLFFLVLLVMGGVQIVKSFREKFKDRQRLLLIGVLACGLTGTAMYPHGLVSRELWEAESVLVAGRLGGFDSSVQLKLMEDQTFREKAVGLGMYESLGKYRIADDTVHFYDVSTGLLNEAFYEFALIKQDSAFEEDWMLVYYENQVDTVGRKLWISKNELNLQKTVVGSVQEVSSQIISAEKDVQEQHIDLLTDEGKTLALVHMDFAYKVQEHLQLGDRIRLRYQLVPTNEKERHIVYAYEVLKN